MLKFIKRRMLTALVVGAVGATSMPAFAEYGDYPNDFAMAGDLLVARPLGLVWTVAGSAIFVVSLPFTAIARQRQRRSGYAGRWAGKRDVRPLPGMRQQRPLLGSERRSPNRARR